MVIIHTVLSVTGNCGYIACTLISHTKWKIDVFFITCNIVEADLLIGSDVWVDR